MLNVSVRPGGAFANWALPACPYRTITSVLPPLPSRAKGVIKIVSFLITAGPFSIIISGRKPEVVLTAGIKY